MSLSASGCVCKIRPLEQLLDLEDLVRPIFEGQGSLRFIKQAYPHLKGCIGYLTTVFVIRTSPMTKYAQLGLAELIPTLAL